MLLEVIPLYHVQTKFSNTIQSQLQIRVTFTPGTTTVLITCRGDVGLSNSRIQ